MFVDYIVNLLPLQFTLSCSIRFVYALITPEFVLNVYYHGVGANTVLLYHQKDTFSCLYHAPRLITKKLRSGADAYQVVRVDIDLDEFSVFLMFCSLAMEVLNQERKRTVSASR